MKFLKDMAVPVLATALIIGGALFLFGPSNGHDVHIGGGRASAETFSEDPGGAPAARGSEVVDLKDGGTYDLTASIVKKNIGGRELKMLAYNGQIPGPLIKVAEGSEVTINLQNNIDADTSLHSHGVRLENKFDGAPPLTQKPVKPGKIFAYKVKFPDAGMYWYHSHVREDYEQELGLYGNYLVVPRAADYWNPVNREVPLFLDDILIEDGSTLQNGSGQAGSPQAGRVVFSQGGADRTLMGRFGNVMLVNSETDYVLSAKKGEVIRFYITNSANTRPFNFSIAGAKLKLVGSDGGAYERESFRDAVLVGPSERFIIEALFDQSGAFTIQNKTPDKTYTLGKVLVSDELVGKSYATEFWQLKTHNQIVAGIDPFRQYFAKEPDKAIKLSIKMGGGMMNEGRAVHQMGDDSMMRDSAMSSAPDGTFLRQGFGGQVEWEDANQMMNQMSSADSIKWKIVDEDTGKENMDIDWTFRKGELVKIRIFNDPNSAHSMQHPIHFHGQRFLVLLRNGVKETNLVWKDTVFIPSGETVDILLDASNPGAWMAHCHIAEHLEAGMMMKFKVE